MCPCPRVLITEIYKPAREAGLKAKRSAAPVAPALARTAAAAETCSASLANIRDSTYEAWQPQPCPPQWSLTRITVTWSDKRSADDQGALEGAHVGHAMRSSTAVRRRMNVSMRVRCCSWHPRAGLYPTALYAAVVRSSPLFSRQVRHPSESASRFRRRLLPCQQEVDDCNRPAF